jgi:hypothetical protein
MLRECLTEISENEYKSQSGYTMRREDGTTPMGNPINGRWVLRDPNGEWIGVDQYRHDLAPRHGFDIK